jgi:hypothetical protein
MKRCAVLLATLAGLAYSQPAGLQLDPPHTSGQGITAAFEGWYPNPDGTANILIGYYNRNQSQELDIPIGPNNHIDPAGPDQGQPTHFVAGRGWGVFTIKVPKGFGDKKLTWTLTVNGKTTSVPVNTNPLYVVSPFIEATGNTPPFIAFEEEGPFIQGPPKDVSRQLTAKVGEPVPLRVWVADDAKIPPPLEQFAKMLPAVRVKWTKFRGPGAVTFESVSPKVVKAEFKAPPTSIYTGKSATTATFSDPGDYILEVVANDLSGNGGGGFQCCWTTAQVRVTVKP